MRLRHIAAVFLRIGVLGFGGPAAHLGLMQDELVRKRGWLDARRFTELVGVTNLIPGPNSSEVAIHTGYVLAGVRGGLVAGACFALPATIFVTALAAAYFASGGFSVRDDLFAGMEPVVVVVMVLAIWRLRSAVENSLGALIAVAAFALTLAFPGWEPVWLLGAAAIALAFSGVRRDERGSVLPGVAILGAAAALAAIGASELPALAWVFLKTGLLLFGGGYVLIPLLQPEVIGRGWLTDAQFLDGIALGQATPGPIVTASAFVGYGVAGVGGAAVATAAIYLPAFVAVLAGTGPFLRAFRERPAVRAAVAGVSAAALGEIGAAAVTLGRHALDGPLRIAVGAAAVVALLARAPTWAVLLAGAAAGVITGAFT